MDKVPSNKRPLDTEEVLQILDNVEASFLTQEGLKVKSEIKNNTNILKKDLLRRKIQEHFSKHPKAKSVIVVAGVDPNKTVWKVDRIKKGFNIVEVNTQREHFIFEAVPGTLAPGASMPLGGPPTGGQSPEFRQIIGIISPVMGNLGTSQAEAAKAREQVNSLIGKLRNPREKAQAAGFLSFLSTIGTGMASAPPTAPIGQAPGGVPTPSGKSGLSSGKHTKGKKIHEKEEKSKKPEKEEERPKKKYEFEPKEKDEPKKNFKPSVPPVVDPPEAGIETGADETPSAPSPEMGQQPEAPPEEKPKTGEEAQLKQIVAAKPIKNLEVFGDEKGSHIILTLGGLKNPIQFNFSRDGKITYKLGELSRVLKVGER